MNTPQQVWAGFDPRKEPLEIETIRKWSERGADCHEFYFTCEKHGAESARIYAIYSAPTGGKNLPAMLHIHGGGQTVMPEWLEYWNDRGYAALTFNWGGEWDDGRKHNAIWGKRLRHCNHRYAGDKIEAVRPTPRESSWYHWTVASSRALTVLERQKEVDPGRLGIFGISMGGTIVWNLAGFDRRVKAACAIYGVGWNNYPASKYDPQAGKLSRDKKIWVKTMAPEAYAPLVRCPVLFLSGTNDFHGKMDWAYDTFRALDVEWRAAFTPHYTHHVAEAEGVGLSHWMDTHLKGAAAWPKAPRVQVALDAAGVPKLTVHADQPEDLKCVKVFYALENDDPKNRFWRLAPVRGKGTTWTASLPVLNVRKRMFAFAEACYKRGMSMAGNFEVVIPSELGQAKATDKPSLVISDFTKDWDGFSTSSVGVDPYAFVEGLARVRGPGRRWGIRSLYWVPVLCFKPADPKWRGPDGSALAFDVYTREPVSLKISVAADRFNPGAREYTATVVVKAATSWQSVRLAPSGFKNAKGRHPGNWREIDLFEIESGKCSQEQPLFTNFRWAMK
ncbi:MAG: dienelactone hydrolase family protein [bacterium]